MRPPPVEDAAGAGAALAAELAFTAEPEVELALVMGATAALPAASSLEDFLRIADLRSRSADVSFFPRCGSADTTCHGWYRVTSLVLWNYTLLIFGCKDRILHALVPKKKSSVNKKIRRPTGS